MSRPNKFALGTIVLIILAAIVAYFFLCKSEEPNKNTKVGPAQSSAHHTGQSGG